MFLNKDPLLNESERKIVIFCTFLTGKYYFNEMTKKYTQINFESQ